MTRLPLERSGRPEGIGRTGNVAVRQSCCSCTPPPARAPAAGAVGQPGGRGATGTGVRAGAVVSFRPTVVRGRTPYQTASTSARVRRATDPRRTCLPGPLRVTPPIYPLFTSCEEENLLHGSGRRHVVPWPVGRLTERVYWRWAPRVGDGRGVKIEAELDAVASSSPGSCRTIGAARARGLVAAIVLPPRRRRTRMVPMDQRIESYPLLFGPRRSVPLHVTEYLN